MSAPTPLADHAEALEALGRALARLLASFCTTAESEHDGAAGVSGAADEAEVRRARVELHDE